MHICDKANCWKRRSHVSRSHSATRTSRHLHVQCMRGWPVVESLTRLFPSILFTPFPFTLTLKSIVHVTAAAAELNESQHEFQPFSRYSNFNFDKCHVYRYAWRSQDSVIRLESSLAKCLLTFLPALRGPESTYRVENRNHRLFP